MEKKVQYIILSRLFSVLFFLVVMIVVNALIPSINNNLYEVTVNFFNSNLLFVLVLMFLSILNEVFWSFYFPFNFIAPITSGALAVYITMFAYKIWNFLDSFMITGITVPIVVIYFVVFLVSIIFGYLFILDRGGRPKEDWGDLWNWQKGIWKKSEGRIAKFEEEKTKKKAKSIGWNDVGDQFKLFFFNLGKSMNKSFERKKK